MVDKKRKEVLLSLLEMQVNENRNIVFPDGKKYRNFRDAFDRIKKRSYKKFAFSNIKNLEYKVTRLI